MEKTCDRSSGNFHHIISLHSLCVFLDINPQRYWYFNVIPQRYTVSFNYNVKQWLHMYKYFRNIPIPLAITQKQTPGEKKIPLKVYLPNIFVRCTWIQDGGRRATKACIAPSSSPSMIGQYSSYHSNGLQHGTHLSLCWGCFAGHVFTSYKA